MTKKSRQQIVEVVAPLCCARSMLLWGDSATRTAPAITADQRPGLLPGYCGCGSMLQVCGFDGQVAAAPPFLTRTPKPTASRSHPVPFLPGTLLCEVISQFLLGFSSASSTVAERARTRGVAMSASSSSEAAAAAGKMTMVVGVDDSEPSWYALQWTLQHFFSPSGQLTQQQYHLVVVTAKPTAACNVGLAGPGAADVVSFVEADLKRSSKRVIDKAKQLCAQAQVSDAVFEVVEGDARNVLCEAVEKHRAELLVVGSHGYGAIKRAVLGSVSDYCIHHAQCTVMIAKKPKNNQ